MNLNTKPRHFGLWVGALIWLCAATIMIAGYWVDIRVLNMPDADDYLRLQQVRDWLAGQSWFDVTQYRINPPEGAPMHWSRLVDLPIAGSIILFEPLLGREIAERIAVVAVPMATLAIVMALAFQTAKRLVGGGWAIMAAACVPLCGIIYTQISPMRIDHHGWQIVCALAMILALFDEARPTRSGVLAGLSGALWMHISIEGLPLTATAGALLAARWAMRDGDFPRLRAFAVALAAASAALHLITSAPPNLLALACDRLSIPHFAALALIAAATVGIGGPRGKLAGLERWQGRMLALSITGAAALALAAGLAPACLSGPFSNLEPGVAELWLERVGESQSLLAWGARTAFAHCAFTMAGIAGAAMAFRGATGVERFQWSTLLCALIVGSALMLIVGRTGAVAQALAIPGAVFFARELLHRARRISFLLARVAATAGALSLGTPVAYLLLSLSIQQANIAEAVRGISCIDYSELPALSAGRQLNIMAPLDIGPALLTRSPHTIVATGHHRNHIAMAEVISVFTGPEQTARGILQRRRIDFLLICTQAHEARLYQRAAPNGLMNRLVTGEPPEWLTPTPNGPNSGLRLYRVSSPNASAPKGWRAQQDSNLQPPA